jgi:peroxiredoxin Q/BCP
MHKAMILAAVLMMSTGTNAQTSAPELKVGDQAPDFTLQASDGKTYKLADFKGKKAVVVAWFPKAFTSGCTIECKSLAQNGDKIRKFNVAYFMASVDPVDQRTVSRAGGRSTSARTGRFSGSTRK